MSTADTWDSYEPTLLLVLNNLMPKRCFEWGAGKSTKTISDHPAVVTMESVEHNHGWVDRARVGLNDKVNIIYEPNVDLYPLVQGRYDRYDLIFIDGVLRETCLEKAKEILSEEGVVILHDAERTGYQKNILEYRYRIWKDFGHTVVLTDSNIVYDELMSVFDRIASV